MNWLETSTDTRPDLPTRERVADKIEVRCPACGHWRRGFLLEPLSAEDAATLGDDWACDAERSHIVRQVAAAEALPDTSRWIPLAVFLGLFTDAQKAAAWSSADTGMQALLLTTLGNPMINLEDARVIAGIDYMASIALLDAGDVTRIKAGDPPPGNQGAPDAG